MAVPPLPPGYKLGGKPKVALDPFNPLLSAGVEATNGYRTPGDIQRLRAQGYKPAAKSLHLDGDALDLVPGKSGMTMGQLKVRADMIARNWPGGKVLNEGDHIHAQLPGWGMAPGTPGTPNSGLPPLPAGAKLTQRGSLKATDYRPASAAPTAALGKPTGRVHDGDTFRLSTGPNARLLGVDAFELTQQGMTPKGAVPLGQMARGALVPFAVPSATFAPNGSQTYGRPVGSLNNGGDAGRAILDQGLGFATPEYLKADPQRLREYMEAERLARLNRRGAFQTTFNTPGAERDGAPDPWAKPEASEDGKGVAYFWDEPTPFQGLRKDIADKWTALHLDRRTTAAQIIAFAGQNGFAVDPKEAAKFIRTRDKHPERPIATEANWAKVPRVLTDPGDGKLGVTLRGVADPINMLDELGAVADSLGATNGRESLWNSDRRFGDIFANNLDQNRSILAHDEATHPYYRMGGQLGGSLIVPGGAGVRTIRGLMKVGAVEGGLAGFGAGETMSERLTNAPLGAMAGAGGGLALGALGTTAANGLRSLRRKRLGNVVEDARYQPQGPASASMRMENDAAELLGPVPRQPDRIDVSAMPDVPEGYALGSAFGNTRPMGDRATAEQMAEMAARVAPGDVTPIPASEVSTLEQHLQRPSAIQDLVAPDEYGELATRRLTDGRSTRYQKGPIDLVGYVRRLGGLRDDAGELAHLGIDNAPRGMDFARNEQFLGRLVNQDGNALDDAALSAWEAGFFPHLRERPTIDEFLDALSDTHRGDNRMFHPDDLAEVEAFNAARYDRNKIEEAAASGTPLAEEVGQPIGPDDLDANQTPVTAYEDLPTLGGKAGNIDLDRLETRGDIRRALTNTESMFGGFDAARRGAISHAETAALADELGMRADDLLKRRHGQAMNAEEALAARRILARSGDELVALATKAKGGSEEALATFQKAMLRHAAIQEQVTGATAEAGRALSQFKMAARSKDHRESIMRAIIDGAGGRDSLEQVAERIIDLQKVPGALNKFAADAAKPTWKDKAVELYYNSILSGPQTHAVNIVSNALTAGLSVTEQATASVLGGVRAGAGKLIGRQVTDRVLGSELGPRIVGLMQGAMEGLQAARLTFKTGKVPDMVSKVEAATQEAIPGKMGHVLRTPTRALSAEDEFFKAVARRSELAALAVRKAHGEGLKGDALTARIDELNRSPDGDMMAQAMDFARYQTFQRQVGPVAGAVLSATRSVPWLKLIVPFVRTPTNILKYATERSPAAPVLKEWRADFMAGGAKRDLAIARASLGTGLGMVVAQLAEDGLITGGGPADGNAKAIKLADGWQPYSFKVGDKYYSYQRLDPLASTIGVAADYVDKQSAMTDRQRDESAMVLTASIIQNLSDKTWLSGMSDLIAAISDPMRGGPAFIRKTAAGVATPAAMGQLARTLDDTPRETKTIGEAIQARIPGLSDSLRPRLDAWGRPMHKEGGVGPNIVSPIYLSTERQEAINREALRLNLKLSEPSRMVGGKRLGDEQFHQYRMLAGQMTARTFGELIASPEYRAMTSRQQQDAFDDLKTDAREAARGALLGDTPPAGKLPPLPPGSTMPPLPPGARLIGGPR